MFAEDVTPATVPRIQEPEDDADSVTVHDEPAILGQAEEGHFDEASWDLPNRPPPRKRRH
jgi:hypothetical protein